MDKYKLLKEVSKYESELKKRRDDVLFNDLNSFPIYY
jgi:hypothetical protein